MTKLFVSP